MRLLIILSVIGLTGCAERATTSGLCIGLRPSVADLRSALLDNPQTPEAVGEAGTDVVIGFNAGCAQ